MGNLYNSLYPTVRKLCEKNVESKLNRVYWFIKPFSERLLCITYDLGRGESMTIEYSTNCLLS